MMGLSDRMCRYSADRAHPGAAHEAVQAAMQQQLARFVIHMVA